MSDVMQAEEILAILPHRYPFMLVDRIIEISEDRERIVGLKNLTFNELFFQGHFPGNPVMPGVLQLEAMAQVAGVMLNLREGNQGRIAYFMSINNAKFRRMVKPGDQLRMEIEAVRLRSRIAVVKGLAYVGDELASEAELTFGYGAE
jgi:3-hydroxyacyl-[acyl-carrier-protein] dehydratase